MGRSIKHYNDFSISTELLEHYRAMSFDKRLEWLYLGNVMRKVFTEMMDKDTLDAGEQKEVKV